MALIQGLGIGSFLLFFFGFLWVIMAIVHFVMGIRLFFAGMLMFLIVLAVLTLSPKDAAVNPLAVATVYGSADPFQTYATPYFTSLQVQSVIGIGVVLLIFAIVALVGCVLFESLDLRRAKRIPAD